MAETAWWCFVDHTHGGPEVNCEMVESWAVRKTNGPVVVTPEGDIIPAREMSDLDLYEVSAYFDSGQYVVAHVSDIDGNRPANPSLGRQERSRQ